MKRHIKRVLDWLSRKGVIDYLWFVEFQQRGAPHIHMLLDLHQFQADLHRRDLAKYWSELVEPNDWDYCRLYYDKRATRFQNSLHKPSSTSLAVYKVHSHPKMWEGVRKKDGAARYVTKYATKAEQKLVPSDYANMGRFWGAPHHNSLKKLIKTWIYTDDNGAQIMANVMGRDMEHWEYLPKIILGNTDKLLTMLKDSV